LHKYIAVRIKKKLKKIKLPGSAHSGLISDTRKQFKGKQRNSWLSACVQLLLH